MECHGTGTALGDPIEFGAQRAVLGRGRAPAEPLVVGAVKTNVGHLEGAAGLAGLLKALLVLRHGVAPANLHLQAVNPHLDLEGYPVLFPTPWAALEFPLDTSPQHFLKVVDPGRVRVAQRPQSGAQWRPGRGIHFIFGPNHQKLPP